MLPGPNQVALQPPQHTRRTRGQALALRPSVGDQALGRRLQREAVMQATACRVRRWLAGVSLHRSGMWGNGATAWKSLIPAIPSTLTRVVYLDLDADPDRPRQVSSAGTLNSHGAQTTSRSHHGHSRGHVPCVRLHLSCMPVLALELAQEQERAVCRGRANTHQSGW